MDPIEISKLITENININNGIIENQRAKEAASTPNNRLPEQVANLEKVIKQFGYEYEGARTVHDPGGINSFGVDVAPKDILYYRFIHHKTKHVVESDANGQATHYFPKFGFNIDGYTEVPSMGPTLPEHLKNYHKPGFYSRGRSQAELDIGQ